MAEPSKSLYDAVRASCPPGLWSLGVKLAREGAVSTAHQEKGEVVFRVRSALVTAAPTVTLYTETAEWSCDCAGKFDPCSHVAAAVIAVRQAAERGEVVKTAVHHEAKLSYRLFRGDPRMRFERWLVFPNGEERLLDVQLSTLLARPDRAPVNPTHEDLLVDRIVSSWRPGTLEWHRAESLLAALATARAEVLLDGKSVDASGERIFPRATLDDEDKNVVLRIERNPEVTELVGRGLALCGNALRPLGETELTGERLERLPLVRTFTPGDLGTLASQALPAIERKMPVEVRTKRVPRQANLGPPRLLFDYKQTEHTLSVLPLLVYGDPPGARIDDGKLVLLKGPVPERDEVAERALTMRLRDQLNLAPGRMAHFDGRDAARFVERARAFRGGSGATDLLERKPLVPRVVVDGDRLQVTFEMAEGDDEKDRDGEADAHAVFRAWRDGLGVVPLSDGRFAPLPVDWLTRYGEQVADLLAARRDDDVVPMAAIPALAVLCSDLDLPPPVGLARIAPLLAGFDRIPEATLPTDLGATLRPYQRHGVDWLCFLRDLGLGAVLADDMGLGKTFQALCSLRGRSLVVCPRSVIHNWADEIKKFRPGLRVCTYHGPGRVLDREADVTLTTYAVLRLDIEAIMKESWDVVVLDEAQNIKNAGSQSARAAFALDAPFRIALSGTPVENRLDELWSLFHFTNRGLLGSASDFDERYAGPVGLGNREAGQRLRAKIRPFLLRRLKKEVAPELPPRTEAVLYCELDESERQVYEAVRLATHKEVVAQLAQGGSVLRALEALLRLRQAACHPALVPGQKGDSSAKIERLVEALGDAAADGHKALVFSQWTSFLDLVEPHLTAAAIPFVRLDGSTRDRGAVVAAFQAPDGPPVMLVSLKAGGTGLNLTAADHVFLLDPWWNPAVEDQAADRAHRIGQDRPVMVYRLVAKDTVEERILELQEKKRRIAAVALEAGDHGAGLTRDDLLALLA